MLKAERPGKYAKIEHEMVIKVLVVEGIMPLFYFFQLERNDCCAYERLPMVIV